MGTAGARSRQIATNSFICNAIRSHIISRPDDRRKLKFNTLVRLARAPFRRWRFVWMVQTAGARFHARENSENEISKYRNDANGALLYSQVLIWHLRRRGTSSRVRHQRVTHTHTHTYPGAFDTDNCRIPLGKQVEIASICQAAFVRYFAQTRIGRRWVRWMLVDCNLCRMHGIWPANSHSNFREETNFYEPKFTLNTRQERGASYKRRMETSARVEHFVMRAIIDV